MRIFSLDGPFNKYGTIVFDLMVLTFLWILMTSFSFALLAPLATAGFLNAINRTMIAGDGYMLKGFFAPFKKNILRNLGINFSFVILIGASVFNIYTVLYGLIPYVVLLPIYTVILLEVLMCAALSLSLMMETDYAYTKTIKIAFILANKHIFYSLLIGIMIIATIILAIIFTPVTLVLTIAPVHLISAKIIYKKILDKYYLDKL